MTVVPLTVYSIQFLGQLGTWYLPARIRLGTCSSFCVSHKRITFNAHTNSPAYTITYLNVLNFLFFYLSYPDPLSTSSLYV